MLLTIRKILQETNDTKSFELEAPVGEPLPARSGQFLTFRFYDINGDEQRRSYSLASSPELHEPLMITVKRIPNGVFSRPLHDYRKVGDQLDTIGVSGFFTLPEKPETHNRIIFFAAGSGIVPVYSMIKTILYTHPTIPVVLIYSNSNKRKAIFYKELKEMLNLFKFRFKIEFLFSSSHNLLRARLNPELLEQLVTEYGAGLPSETLYYTCGPYDYMRMITIRLLTMKVPEENIRKEIFFVQKVEPKLLPPDILPHIVKVEYKGNNYEFVSQYPSTILQTAKRIGISLPYSCEAGQCGTCALTCVDGKVWMSHNEVLLDEEIIRKNINMYWLCDSRRRFFKNLIRESNT